MQLVHYSNNDDLSSMAQKNDTNFRRMATQLDQKFGPMMGSIEELSERVSNVESDTSDLNDLVSTLSDDVGDIDDKVNSIVDTIYPIGIHIITDSDPSNMYDGTNWNEIGTITIGSSSVRVWQRVY